MIVIIGLIGIALIIGFCGILYNTIVNLMVNKENATKWRKYVESDE